MVNVVAHHSLTKDGEVKDYIAIKYYHVTTLLMIDIAYHYVIERVMGRVYVFKGREEWKKGAHTKGFNEWSIGICWVGNYDISALPQDMFDAGIELLDDIASRHGGINISGHCDHPHPVTGYRKTCPGKKFPLAQLKSLYNEKGYRQVAEKKITLESLDARLKVLERAIPISPKIPVETPKSKPVHKKIGLTHLVEIDPKDLRIHILDGVPSNQLDNMATSGYQWYHPSNPCPALGILVSEGKILSNRQPHYKPAGTLIVYDDGNVAIKPILNIKKEKNVFFAVSGCSVYPRVRMDEEGFVGRFSDIGRTTQRMVIGYRAKDNKIIIAYRPNSSVTRAYLTLKNLGCDAGITLDSGGSSLLRIGGRTYRGTARKLYSIITW